MQLTWGKFFEFWASSDCHSDSDGTKEGRKEVVKGMRPNSRFMNEGAKYSLHLMLLEFQLDIQGKKNHLEQT